MKPFLILQLRPEDQAADNELAAILQFGGLEISKTRRIRMEQGNLPNISLSDYSGVIVGGGPSNVSDPEGKKSAEQKRFEKWLQPILSEVVANDTPYLGACYGLGALAATLGGEVSKDNYSEDVGASPIILTRDGGRDPLLAGLPLEFMAMGGHKEAVQSLPPKAVHLAETPTCPMQMIRVGENVYATQFHTELDSAGLELRINIYKHAGYFPPEEADALIAEGHRHSISVPQIILKRFVDKYRI